MIFTSDDWKLRAPATLLVSFYWLFGCGGSSSHVDDNNIRTDVIDCEEAAAHLKECCPNATSLPDCHYSKTVYTCGWPIEFFASDSIDDQPITTGESASVNGSSCAELQNGGTCDRQWPQTQPDTAHNDEQQQNDISYDEAHPDGRCGEWGQP
jgi:hypothetical protein